MFFGSVVFFSYLHVFFFFKQKTAYEMRISDWSSDVCSSDLARHRRPAVTARQWTTGNAASRLSFPRKSWPARCDEEPPLATALGQPLGATIPGRRSPFAPRPHRKKALDFRLSQSIPYEDGGAIRPLQPESQPCPEIERAPVREHGCQDA